MLAGFAKLGMKLDDCQGFARPAVSAVQARLGSLTPQQLANVAWALSKVRLLASWLASGRAGGRADGRGGDGPVTS